MLAGPGYVVEGAEQLRGVLEGVAGGHTVELKDGGGLQARAVDEEAGAAGAGS